MIKDINVIEFARKISMLSVDTPISNNYDKEYGQKENRWWACQREHLTVWCLYQETNGLPGYEHKPNTSARKMYQNFGRPETLLWLLEALGESEEVLNNIVQEIKNESSARRACGRIREKIDFDRIYDLLMNA